MENELETLELPNSVTRIETNAFNDNNLTSITYGNSLTSLGQGAFADNNFTEIVIPESVSSLGGGSFNRNNVTTINGIPSNGVIYDMTRGVVDSTTIVSYGGIATTIDFLSDSITTIGHHAFASIDFIESVVIPNSVTTIESFAFYNMNLPSITFGNSVVTIQRYAFYNNNLTSIEVPNSVVTIGDHAFSNNDLTSVILGDSLTYIDRFAFNANNLASIEIPNSVVFIGEHAFDANASLTEVLLPVDVDELENTVWKDEDGTEVTKIQDFSMEYVITYTVTFNDWDGTLIKEVSTDHGSSAVAPTDPTRTGYTFTGWNLNLDKVKSSFTVTAEYDIISYLVSFNDWDGTLIKEVSADHGSSATAPSDPTRTGYTFTGWNLDFENVTSHLTVTAEYDIISYLVSFNNWDGTLIKEVSTDHGSSAIAPADPTRTGYEFIGWDIDFENVTSHLTVTAEYDIISYLVSFNDWDGTLIKEVSTDHGSSAVAPADPTRTGYEFIGWDIDFENVTSALKVTAQYSKVSAINNIQQSSISIYPNPVTDGILHIEVKKPIQDVRIFNLTGNQVYNSSMVNTNTIMVSNLPSGIYFIQLDELVQKFTIE